MDRAVPDRRTARRAPIRVPAVPRPESLRTHLWMFHGVYTEPTLPLAGSHGLKACHDACHGPEGHLIETAPIRHTHLPEPPPVPEKTWW